ncbi:uncharacterized protein F5147DRAFT_648875 [Suillus discolor]|uniref:Fungal-type protein kinase domain-containing protein n=1 Tax=Suillus discolor TaxID=1912936 RepID=A0A9P7FIK2_9AGAM|nr:uncharacterized protein F5147DRAFT_648875 [Suillus discolor]KAG2117333.1 hypothetical protein F5147DRAFT_648875 [Suillus discolor]
MVSIIIKSLASCLLLARLAHRLLCHAPMYQPVHGAGKIESTPNSRGASVVSENIGVLGVKYMTALVESSDVETAFKEYVRPGVEHNFYGPLIRATNIALACLEEIKVDGMCVPVPAVDMICHLTLWKEGVYHRDVSPGNLMWYWKDGKRIDYPGPRGNERTGMVLFMALDLLTIEGQRGEIKHLYRHDLESFMRCFVWISLRYREGVLLSCGLHSFDEWATLGAVA